MIKHNGLSFRCLPNKRISTSIVDVRGVPDGFNASILNRLHLDRGWLGAGYHYHVDKFGLITKLRDDDLEGVDCKREAICICVEGKLSFMQRQTLRVAMLKILATYPKCRIVEISKNMLNEYTNGR